MRKTLIVIAFVVAFAIFAAALGGMGWIICRVRDIEQEERHKAQIRQEQIEQAEELVKWKTGR